MTFLLGRIGCARVVYVYVRHFALPIKVRVVGQHNVSPAIGFAVPQLASVEAHEYRLSCLQRLGQRTFDIRVVHLIEAFASGLIFLAQLAWRCYSSRCYAVRGKHVVSSCRHGGSNEAGWLGSYEPTIHSQMQ